MNHNVETPRKGAPAPSAAASAPATPISEGPASGAQAPSNQHSAKILLLSFEEQQPSPPAPPGAAHRSTLSLITIEALQVMLSRYGALHKIVLFDSGKGNGKQALVQFVDASAAAAAERDLGGGVRVGGGRLVGGGKPFPSSALPVARPPIVRSQVSTQRDLSVRFQSDRKRDFLANLPSFSPPGGGGGGFRGFGGGAPAAVATMPLPPPARPAATNAATTTPTPAVPPPRARREVTPPAAPAPTPQPPPPAAPPLPEEADAEAEAGEAPTSGKVLLVALDDGDNDDAPAAGEKAKALIANFKFSPLALGKLFGPHGLGVAKVSVFRRKGEPRALVQMRDEASAAAALEALDGRRLALPLPAAAAEEKDNEKNVEVLMRLSYSVHSEVRVPGGSGPEKAVDFTAAERPPPPPRLPPSSSSSLSPAPAPPVAQAPIAPRSSSYERDVRAAEEAARAAEKAAAAAAARLRPAAAAAASAHATGRNANNKRPATAPPTAHPRHSLRSCGSSGGGSGSGSGSEHAGRAGQSNNDVDKSNSSSSKRPASATVVLARRSSGGGGTQQLQEPPIQPPQWNGGFAPPSHPQQQQQQHNGGFYYARLHPPPPPPSAFHSAQQLQQFFQQQQEQQHQQYPYPHPPSWHQPPPH